jgi:hypothetical protein
LLLHETVEESNLTIYESSKATGLGIGVWREDGEKVWQNK